MGRNKVKDIRCKLQSLLVPKERQLEHSWEVLAPLVHPIWEHWPLKQLLLTAVCQPLKLRKSIWAVSCRQLLGRPQPSKWPSMPDVATIRPPPPSTRFVPVA